MNDRAYRILAGVIMAAICGILIYVSSLHLTVKVLP